MSHPWHILSYPLASEKIALANVAEQLSSVEEGAIVVLPEYLAYTRDNSLLALEYLVDVCRTRKINVMTTLNLVPDNLPHAEPGRNYNVLTIVNRHGDVYTPQAKITPQSFERVQFEEKFPAMNVGDYTHLNRVTLDINGQEHTAFFVICSDIYSLLLGVQHIEHLKADYAIVPGNFGNKAERAVDRILRRFRDGGVFRTTIFSNPYQVLKDPSKAPLVQQATEYVERSEDEQVIPLTDWDRIQLFKENVAVYPDEFVPSFVHMTGLTIKDEGRLTVGLKRFATNVTIDTYSPIISL
ncbi:hypothetical protein DFP93_107132 [Aneurinibacillus soli]|uniref:Uncharacterized protein n=1 Tax=Aneurinibacillus soli TaxID=1500254 RepID=A0A0U5AXD8_9BACL|nr:hypothetical protein [Aneurinibacillus soli]PYE61741.1 hypothetical protein DFP93_107132 [Aneurinibacillus soli]BAU28401.1 hypothetical protein CB4_02575 [Aneurinibacillus soli]